MIAFRGLGQEKAAATSEDRKETTMRQEGEENYLCFVALCRYCGVFVCLFFDFLIQTKSVATLHKQAYQHRLFKSICSLCVSVSHFGNSHNISEFFIIITCVKEICD